MDVTLQSIFAATEQTSFQLIKDIFELLSFIATTTGIFLAILVFREEKRREMLQRERETYIEANARYLDYLKLCLQHPESNFLEFTKNDPVLSKTNAKELTLYTILICLLESGYVLYKEPQENLPNTFLNQWLTQAKNSDRLKQWEGWEKYIKGWAEREDFQNIWPVLSDQFDHGFVTYVSDLIEKSPQKENTTA